MLPAMPRPRHAAFRQQDLQIRLRGTFANNQPHGIDIAIGGQPRTVVIGIGDGGRQCYPLHVRCQRLQPGQAEAQQIPALAIGKRMNLVDNYALQRREQQHAILMTEQQ